MDERLRKIYFLFSKLKAPKTAEPVVELVLDSFLRNENKYLTISEVTKEIIELGFNKQPENISKIINAEAYSGYFETSWQRDGNNLIRLNKAAFQTFKSYADYNEKLSSYVDKYLEDNSLDVSKRDVIIEILLESIFQQNLNILRQLISIKDQNFIDNLFATRTISEFDDGDVGLYNDFIMESDETFTEILKVLLLKVFDFLKFHYNPDVDKSLNKLFKDKEFYLDSSFVIRLLGFHGDYRTERGEALLNILTKRKSIKFILHRKTLNEIERSVLLLVKRLERLLQRSDNYIRKLVQIQKGKNNEIIELYLRLKENQVVSEYEDFFLYFRKPYYLLQNYFKPNQLKLDDENIDKETGDQKELENFLKNTEKSSNRIDHISKLVAFLKRKRGQNNYNFFDIKYWLLTTDRTTLNVDSSLGRRNRYKSVCIMPTELLRMLGTSSDISTDIIDVFKKFMLQTRTLNITDYTDEQVDFIDKVLTLSVSAAEKTNYDVEFILDRFFEEYTLNELETRLRPIHDVEEKNRTLVELFSKSIDNTLKTDLLKQESNQRQMAELISHQMEENAKNDKYREWYNQFIDKYEKKQIFIFKILHAVLIWFIPTTIFFVLLWKIKSENAVWYAPNTYFDLVKANLNQLYFWLFDVVVFGVTIPIYRKTKSRFVNYFVRNRLTAVSITPSHK